MWAPTSSYISFCDFLVAFGYRSILISTGRFEIKAIQLIMVLFTNCECSFNRYLAPEYFVYGNVNDKTDVYAFVRENNWNEVNQYKKSQGSRKPDYVGMFWF